MEDGYVVHPHPGGVWIQTPDGGRVLAQLRELLAFSRIQPIPWHPIPVLHGPAGSGKSAVIEQLIREARGAVRCRFGCPGLCMPARRLEMEATLSGDADPDFYRRPGPVGPRRTTLVFVEDADALLRVSRRRREDVVADLRRRDGFVHCFVGSYHLADQLGADSGANVQEMRLPGLSGRDFCGVAQVLFGIGGGDRRAMDALRDLDHQTGRSMGRLVNEARRCGRLDDLARQAAWPALPALARHDDDGGE